MLTTGFKRVKTDTTVTLYEITPKEASKMLKANLNIRTLKPSLVNKYANDMSNGNWVRGGGDPIVIDEDDNIRNGQHRLHAIIKSNTRQQLWLMESAKPEVNMSLDCGAMRSTADYLETPYANQMSTMANIFFALNLYNNNTLERIVNGRIGRNVSSSRIDKIHTYEAHGELLMNYIEKSGSMQKHVDNKHRSHIAIALLLIDQLNPSPKLPEFIAEFSNSMPNSKAVLFCRNKILTFNRNRGNNENGTNFSQKEHNIWTILAAYDLFCAGTDGKSDTAVNKALNNIGKTKQNYVSRYESRCEQRTYAKKNAGLTA